MARKMDRMYKMSPVPWDHFGEPRAPPRGPQLGKNLILNLGYEPGPRAACFLDPLILFLGFVEVLEPQINDFIMILTEFDHDFDTPLGPMGPHGPQGVVKIDVRIN